MGKFADAIEDLDREIAHLRAQLAERESARRLLVNLEGQDFEPGVLRLAQSLEFRGLGWQEAARRVLSESAEAMSTSELEREVTRRGLQSRTRNRSGTLSSALKQRPDLFAYDRAAKAWRLVTQS